LNIANILSIAGAEPQAFTRGEASYGRKRRNAGEEEIITDNYDENVEAKNEEIPDAMADQMTEIENVQALWLEFLQHGISSRKKRHEEKEITSENSESKNEALPDAMADQMTEIENIQAFWLEFLQHGISSRRKRQNLQFEIEATTDNQDKVDPNTKIAVPIQVKVKNWGETGIESQVAGDNRKKRQSLELLGVEATQDNTNTKIAVPIQVKVKNWGETGIKSQVAGINNRKKRQSLELLEEATQDNDDNINAKAVPVHTVKVKNWGETGIQSQNVNNRKKRQSLEFNLEEAIENESIMQEIFQATDDLNAIVIPIKIVEVKNWGETGIKKPSESI